ncbi:unnamed protein product [Heligmosomoides polygyrus]|uniref:Uncharacterized protein n=1 Tax=Heligmosomoides polygyrus TaxID=6339 RepID=A0A3P8DXG0_HELPZ|nr:unnamed protein product [Heligmosomoides polygyrus]
MYTVLRIEQIRLIEEVQGGVAFYPTPFGKCLRLHYLVTRSRSVSDLCGYYRWSDKYKPQYHTVYQTTPYRWRRDWDLYDDYWYDRYYYFSPLYSSYYPSRRYSYSDYLPNPYYWSPYWSYWTRYKGYWYDYDYPYYYRRYYSSPYYSYLNSTYTPYRSYLLDSLSTSLGRGLSMYKAGLIPYRTLDTYWLTPSYWDRRFKDWRELYNVSKDIYLPSTFDRKTRSYLASWST